MRVVAWGAAARLWMACAAVFLVSCSQGPRSALDGVLVFEGPLQLERGKESDTVSREFNADADTTFVFVAVEDDLDFRARLERLTPGQAEDDAHPHITVESRLIGEGIEVGALDVKKGERLLLKLEAPFEYARPGSVRVKLLRYDAAAATAPAVQARVQAFRDWATGTNYTFATDDMRAKGFAAIDAALRHFESADGDPTLGAWGRLIRANANHVYATDQKQSLIDARLAIQAFSKLPDKRSIARARFASARALMQLSLDVSQKDPTADEARSEAKKLLAELEQSPDLSARERARMASNLGQLASFSSDWPAVRQHAERSLAAFRAIGDLDGARTALNNLGAVAAETGELAEAAKVFDQLYLQINLMPMPERRASYIYNGAYSQMNIGSTDKAIERWMTLLQYSREHRMPMFEARALDGLGLAYWQRGDLGQAGVFVEEAMQVRSAIKDPPGVMINMGNAGSLARENGDTSKALELHRAALELMTTGAQRMAGLSNVARDYAVAGDYERAVKTYREALAVPQAPPVPYKIRGVELALAESLLARKGRTARDIEEAAAMGERALKGAMQGGDITQEMAARKVIAQARAARGQMTDAQHEYESAIALIFHYRAMTASPEQQAAVLTRLQATFRGYVDLLMRDVAGRGPGRLAPVGANEENSLRILESARLTSFDAVRMASVDDATQGRIDQLLTQMAGKRVKLASMLDRPGASERDMETLRVDIAKLRTQIDLERAGGSHAAAGDSPLEGITRPWPSVVSGVTQLSYAFGERNAYLWVRDATGIRATVLAASPQAIDREIERVTALLRNASGTDSAKELDRLSGWLLPEGAIAPDSTRLEIVAEGRLATLPFAALSLQHSRRLAETHSIVMIGSTLDAADRMPVGDKHAMRLVALAGFAGPGPVLAKRGLFPALGSTGAEARAIAAMFSPGNKAPDVKLLTGDEGSAESVKAAWMKGADVFHFATHGLADLGQPLASLLMLPAKDSDGNGTYLTAGQVQSWRGDANLVYLSACDTAVGPPRFADGLPGLQRAFLRAGAHGVIATLWPIEDVYASQFATEFYKRYTAGMPAAQALSETQRAWLNPEVVPGTPSGEQARRRATAWAHVYYTR